jgi:phosphate transport system protein
MPELRRQHRDQMAALEERIIAMGSRVLDMLDEAMAALVTGDGDRGEGVVRADDEIDRMHAEVQEGIFRTLSLQAPVASELRLVSALIHANLHTERLGDLCVNIAKFARLVEDLPHDAELLAQFTEMSGHTRRVIARAMEALGRRDAAAARELPALDDPIDQLNRGLFKRLVQLAASDETKLDWAMRMVLVARYLERMGDHAVDIGEQVIFAVTGETVELQSNSPPASLG